MKSPLETHSVPGVLCCVDWSVIRQQIHQANLHAAWAGNCSSQTNIQHFHMLCRHVAYIKLSTLSPVDARARAQKSDKYLADSGWRMRENAAHILRVAWQIICSIIFAAPRRVPIMRCCAVTAYPKQYLYFSSFIYITFDTIIHLNLRVWCRHIRLLGNEHWFFVLFHF